jgi:hypothetical protein
LNLYTYVENNPLKYIDPTGHYLSIPGDADDVGGGSFGWASGAVGLGAILISAIDTSSITMDSLRNKRDEPIYLYHATTEDGYNSIMNKGILLDQNRGNTDFGPGFYVTNDYDQAVNWLSSPKNGGTGNGYVLVFMVDEDELYSFNGKIFPSSGGKDWAETVYNYRRGAKEQEYDFMEGPMLLNTKQKYYPEKYKAGGHQINIMDPYMASWLWTNYLYSNKY